ncbi:maker382 [Drosophila busckii]|uniref:Maker382 n=1 Tax=Drosophila busckii TaxID=30019 RepID=A0A0M4EA20_DROBS|nr:maker382 [Drosophila busckii]
MVKKLFVMEYLLQLALEEEIAENQPKTHGMEQELSDLFDAAMEQIRANQTENVNTADIVRKLIDRNTTGLLHHYPSFCSPNDDAHGVYTVNVTGLQPFSVFCDTRIAGAGWMTQYQKGFGNVSSEFFIGLDKLHALTASRPHELYIYLEDFEGNARYERYDEFLIAGEADKYKLTKLGIASGDAGDSLTTHIGQQFSTHDKDNDDRSEHCAQIKIGAWWYGTSHSDCCYSSLNGLYLNGAVSSNLAEKQIYWQNFKGAQYSYKFVQMMIRPKCLEAYPNRFALEEEIAENQPKTHGMEQELSALFDAAMEQIRANKIENVNTADIIRKLIDRNTTGLLHHYPSFCPPNNAAHGVYTVNVAELQPFSVFCDTRIAGSGWMVIQRRVDGHLNFFRNWTQYQKGFGNVSTEFFIGLDKLHALTASRPHELYIYLEDFEGNARYERYDEFLIAGEADSYRLTKLGTASGDAGDSLIRHISKKFSTYDKDNDDSSDDCAQTKIGAWWYGTSNGYCCYSSLNGLYLKGEVSGTLEEKQIYWHSFKGAKYS